MRKQITYVTLPICAAILVAGAWLANAGDINPPPGPVGPTMVTLDDIFNAIQGGDARTPISALPFTINQCGSYFLTDCLTGQAGQNGITIDADDVTIDLNGFTLLGVPGSLDAIKAQAGRNNTTVKNGTIRAWGGNGLSLGGDGQVRDCNIAGSGLIGIVIGDNGMVVDCRIGSSGGDGLQASGTRGLICNVFASGNGGNGIAAAPGSTVTGCTSCFNTGHGIEVSDACFITANNCNNNGTAGVGAGIHISGSANSITENHVANNQVGIEFGFAGNFFAGIDNIVVQNMVTGSPGGVPGNYVFHPIGVQNTYGELLDFTNVNEINGGNSSHWANFEY